MIMNGCRRDRTSCNGRIEDVDRQGKMNGEVVVDNGGVRHPCIARREGNAGSLIRSFVNSAWKLKAEIEGLSWYISSPISTPWSNA
jgi:hypothetical protein